MGLQDQQVVVREFNFHVPRVKRASLQTRQHTYKDKHQGGCLRSHPVTEITLRFFRFRSGIGLSTLSPKTGKLDFVCNTFSNQLEMIHPSPLQDLKVSKPLKILFVPETKTGAPVLGFGRTGGRRDGNRECRGRDRQNKRDEGCPKRTSQVSHLPPTPVKKVVGSRLGAEGDPNV